MSEIAEQTDGRCERCVLLGLKVAELEREVDRLKQEAQIHAQEARTQKTTVHEIYQIVTDGKGEPGDWNGAQPIKEAFDSLKAQLAVMQWTPITESNLPKVGDEMLELKDSGEIYDIGPVTMNWQKVPVSYVAATCYRRPINPPKEQSNG